MQFLLFHTTWFYFHFIFSMPVYMIDKVEQISILNVRLPAKFISKRGGFVHGKQMTQPARHFPDIILKQLYQMQIYSLSPSVLSLVIDSTPKILQ